MSNYGKLFDEINSNSEWNIRIQWSTLDDYFSSLAKADRTTSALDSLAGDFFTYGNTIHSRE